MKITNEYYNFDGGNMIKVFGQTDKTFFSNGDAVLMPLKARVHKMAQKADDGTVTLSWVRTYPAS